MKLLIFSLGVLAAISTTVAAAVNHQADSSTLANRDTAQDFCKAVPTAVTDSNSAICNIASSGAGCKSCDFQWASYNICNCYDTSTDCNSLLASAMECESTCKNYCGENHATHTAVNHAHICNVARASSGYKECHALFAQCEIWKCYGSVFYASAAEADSSMSMFCRYAAKCSDNCAKKGGCVKH